jgi:outer membrane immunogenic protein
MHKLLIATAAVALATAGTASAADLPTKAPPMVAAAPVQTWTGCYISGGVGYGMWNQENHPETFPGQVALTNIDQTAGGRGWLGRFGAGCDYQVAPQFLIGAFGDYDWENIHGTFQDLLTGFVGNEKLSHSWAVGGRIGYLPYPNLLTFVSGGWTQAHFDSFDLSLAFPPNTAILNVPSQTYNGWFIGGGTEYRLPWFQGLTWKTEYRFAQYRSQDLPVTLVGTGISDGFAEHNEKFVQTVTTSLVWRFNWFGSPVVARY